MVDLSYSFNFRQPNGSEVRALNLECVNYLEDLRIVDPHARAKMYVRLEIS